MSQQFLYEQLDGAKKMGLLPMGDVPASITDNLSPFFSLRKYQKEAFTRFFHCYTKPFEGKEYPLHLLFNMATGSGKTLVMAGLILYLYEQGYRNFLFFVNSNNIITKTRENFLDSTSSKYLFAQDISIGNKRIQVRSVNNFEGTNSEGINICFTTLQKLHGDLTNEKENSLTFDDFKNKKIVLLSDEAHHTQKVTKQGVLSEKFESSSWENTVEKILKQNDRNVLLEFTATMDFLNSSIKEKYLNKVLYKYDLKEFRNDGFSKDPEIFATDTDRSTRMLQAIIVSQYRQEVATAHGIPHFKPVVLFKAQNTISQSHENKALFHKLIDSLSVEDIKAVRSNNAEILKNAFHFFEKQKITDSILIRKLKDGFADNKCITVNEESLDKKSLVPKERLDVLAQQKMLNSLEDKYNQIRAIFAVQKLNEGWDVLNLFDIVRMYEVRDSGKNKLGATTISEAQLIGRGARYYPFSLNNEDDRFTRKFDKDLYNELRILEELHYHCHPGDRSRYITDIKQALIQAGLMDEHEREVEIRLKDSFKDTPFYRTGIVYANDRVKYIPASGNNLSQLTIAKRNHEYVIYSGIGSEEGVFQDKEILKIQQSVSARDIKLSDIEPHVIRAALARNDFFTFNNLKIYFPRLESTTAFIESKGYLNDLTITFRGTENGLDQIENKIAFNAVLELLSEIESELRQNTTGYTGTYEFKPKAFKLVFEDKKIKVKNQEDNFQNYLENLSWYAYDSNFGTSDEKDLIQLIERYVSDFKKEFKNVYLVRNEQQLKIYNFSDGRGFEPDFLLFLVNKKGENVTYQLFIEPKGGHLREYDKWKNDFLEQITKRYGSRTFTLGSKGYQLHGVPFYETENENQFLEKIKEIIK